MAILEKLVPRNRALYGILWSEQLVGMKGLVEHVSRSMMAKENLAIMYIHIQY